MPRTGRGTGDQHPARRAGCGRPGAPPRPAASQCPEWRPRRPRPWNPGRDASYRAPPPSTPPPPAPPRTPGSGAANGPAWPASTSTSSGGTPGRSPPTRTPPSTADRTSPPQRPHDRTTHAAPAGPALSRPPTPGRWAGPAPRGTGLRTSHPGTPPPGARRGTRTPRPAAAGAPLPTRRRTTPTADRYVPAHHDSPAAGPRPARDTALFSSLLDRIRALLVLFSRTGFEADLVTVASGRRDVQLVGLPMLYGEGWTDPQASAVGPLAR